MLYILKLRQNVKIKLNKIKTQLPFHRAYNANILRSENVEILHSKYTKIQTKLMVLGTERKVASDSTIIKMGLKLPENPPKVIVIK